MRTETININGINYTINIFYEDRKNSRVSISKNSINIRIPLLLTREEQAKQLLEMKSWIKKKLEINPDKFKPKPSKEYKDGDIIKIGDEEYIIKINFKEKESSSGRIVGKVIYLNIASGLSTELKNKYASSLISRCISGKRIDELKEKINELNEKHFKQKVNKIFFKNNKSKWGSCSKKGNINISTRLLFASDDILEYVCIHELAHLIEHNHSNNFWALVERAMPNYREKIEWLRENGHTCEF